MALINKDNLAHYLRLNYNVILRGRHGVGKTAVIKEVFEEAGLKWKYFSASTLDPWIDFVGMPRIVDKPDGSTELKLIRPDFIEHDEVNAIFFDEYNRAPDKVLNATMELIQFGSINGHKLKNLRVIWAAINPEDEEDTYSVNHLDPAHIDRFPVQIDVPYKVDKEYFLKKYPDIGQIFIDWWKGLPVDIRFDVSPRRLDFAAHAYQNKCRLEDFLPLKSNPKALRTMLNTKPVIEKIASVKNKDEAIEFLKDVNNVTKALELLQAEESTVKEFLLKYGEEIPKELSQPFLECLQAKKAGVKVYSCLEEFIEKIDADKGTPEMAAIVNNLNFDLMYTNGGWKSPEHELQTLASMGKQHVVRKLALRFSDILVKCSSLSINRFFWGTLGKQANNPQNFQKLCFILGKIPAVFSDQEKQTINAKLFRSKIVDVPNFLG